MFLSFFASCARTFTALFTLPMNYEQFDASLSLNVPPADMPVLLQALWYDKKGNWEAAHNIAQSREGTKAYDRLHAYLHRVEGDDWNAGYWYRRAGTEVFDGTLQEEWTSLVNELL
jgi:hypothetical protein